MTATDAHANPDEAPPLREQIAGAIEGIWRCGQLDRDPVGRRRPDQGRAADGQPADRGGYLTGGAQLELVLAPRQLGLVDRL